MPRTPIDYSKTLIYKLVHKDDLENSNIYVGSTTDFRRRKWSHKSNCNNVDSDSHYLKVYQNIRENDGWDEWVMLEIEKFPCKDKRDADARERYWCEFYRSTLNTQVPGQSRDEWKGIDINIEKKKESDKQWRKDNTDKKKSNDREYYENHTDECKQRAAEWKTANPERQKQTQKNYHENHKEESKRYYFDNKEKISERVSLRNKQKLTCECGKSMNRSSLQKHKKNICKSLQVT